jgi:hypothetical protein
MRYNIYNNIDDREFSSLKTHLEKIAKKCVEFFPERLKESRREDFSESLTLNFSITTGKPAIGNLYLVFDNTEKDNKYFTLGFVKSVDVKQKRHAVKKVIKSKISLIEFESDLENLLLLSISKFDTVTNEFILSQKGFKLGS